MPFVTLCPSIPPLFVTQRWLVHNLHIPTSEKMNIPKPKHICPMLSKLSTFRYLHNWQAKKKALITSWLISYFLSVVWYLAMSLSTLMGSDFWCNGLGSLFLKAQNLCNRSRLSSPSSSQNGFGLLRFLKIDVINEIEFRTVLSARESTFDPENCPPQTAMSKDPNNLLHSLLPALLRKISSLIPMDTHHLTQQSHNQAWSSCVFPITALLWAFSKAVRSAFFQQWTNA